MRAFLIILTTLIGTAFGLSALASDNAMVERLKNRGWAETDFTRKSIELSEIMSGGPPKDGIPSIDDPQFKPVDEVEIPDREPVIGLSINGDARAYPLRVLTWHEIVNDTVGGKPVAVTYCPLCNAAIVFERIVRGEPTEFGTTGLLRHSDLVMYDRQTESWWQQFTGEAIVGEMTGTELELVPARLESLARFRERHPQGKVLVPNNPSMRAYGKNPYAGYDTSRAPFLYRGDLPEGISPMARVVAYRHGDDIRAFAMKLLADKKRIVDGDVVLEWQPGQASALDASEIAQGRDVGNITVQRRTDDGTLQDIPYDVTFAFVIKAFHPDAEIVRADAS